MCVIRSFTGVQVCTNAQGVHCVASELAKGAGVKSC
jgi:hypothetical protein